MSAVTTRNSPAKLKTIANLKAEELWSRLRANVISLAFKNILMKVIYSLFALSMQLCHNPEVTGSPTIWFGLGPNTQGCDGSACNGRFNWVNGGTFSYMSPLMDAWAQIHFDYDWGKSDCSFMYKIPLSLDDPDSEGQWVGAKMSWRGWGSSWCNKNDKKKKVFCQSTCQDPSGTLAVI